METAAPSSYWTYLRIYEVCTFTPRPYSCFTILSSLYLLKHHCHPTPELNAHMFSVLTENTCGAAAGKIVEIHPCLKTRAGYNRRRQSHRPAHMLLVSYWKLRVAID